MPFGNAVSGPAFGVLNELLGIVRGTDGIARSSRYEVLCLPPSGARGTRNAPVNAWQVKWLHSQEVMLQERCH